MTGARMVVVLMLAALARPADAGPRTVWEKAARKVGEKSLL